MNENEIQMIQVNVTLTIELTISYYSVLLVTLQYSQRIAYLLRGYSDWEEIPAFRTDCAICWNWQLALVVRQLSLLPLDVTTVSSPYCSNVCVTACAS